MVAFVKTVCTYIQVKNLSFFKFHLGIACLTDVMAYVSKYISITSFSDYVFFRYYVFVTITRLRADRKVCSPS